MAAQQLRRSRATFLPCLRALVTVEPSFAHER